MHTLASRGLAEIVIAEGFQVFLEFESKVHDLWKGIPFRRVETKNEVVRFVEMRTTAMNVMQFDGRVIGKPHKTGIIGGDDVVDLLPLCPVVPDLLVIHPLRAVLGAVLLKETLPVNTVGESHQRQRAAIDVCQDCRRNPKIVSDRLRLEDSVFGPQDLLQIGQFDLALAHLGHL